MLHPRLRIPTPAVHLRDGPPRGGRPSRVRQRRLRRSRLLVRRRHVPGRAGHQPAVAGVAGRVLGVLGAARLASLAEEEREPDEEEDDGAEGNADADADLGACSQAARGIGLGGRGVSGGGLGFVCFASDGVCFEVGDVRFGPADLDGVDFEGGGGGDCCGEIGAGSRRCAAGSDGYVVVVFRCYGCCGDGCVGARVICAALTKDEIAL